MQSRSAPRPYRITVPLAANWRPRTTLVHLPLVLPVTLVMLVMLVGDKVGEADPAVPSRVRVYVPPPYPTLSSPFDPPHIPVMPHLDSCMCV